MQAAGPGPGQAHLLEGWFIYADDEQFFGLSHVWPQAIKQIQGMVFHIPAYGNKTENADDDKDSQRQDEGTAEGRLEPLRHETQERVLC